jgi:mono/diheme cytochrome c family protein/glucose/arabinose dehydrogenase
MRKMWLLVVAVACAFTAGIVAKVGDGQAQGRAGAPPQAPVASMPPAPAPVLPPDAALKSLTVAPGYKVEIAASEPLIHAPVAIQFGPDGRLWVVEMNGYSPVLGGAGEDAPNGRVVVLRDRDGDGRYDDATVFLENLILPRSIMLVGDGLLVGSPPELAFWRDTNGDGKADSKVLLASDYGAKPNPKLPLSTNAELFPNGGLWAYDNWIYSAAYMKKFRYKDGAFETAPTIFRGQWGFTQDDYGRFYYNDNTHSLHGDIIFGDYLQRNPHYPRLEGTNVNIAADEAVWPVHETPGVTSGGQPTRELRDGRLFKFTAACGPWIYRGDVMPELYGNAFVAEPVGNLVQRKVLTAENGSVIGRNPYTQADFIASTDERFRPVNFSTGPDGALYVVDMYRGIVEHHSLISAYLREEIKSHELEGPYEYGRIYRVVPIDKPAPRVAQIPRLTSAQWVEHLGDANAWWRETAQQQLVEHHEAAVVPAIRRLATSSPSALGRVQAMWTLEGVGALDHATVMAGLSDKEPVVRAAALRLSERLFKDTAGRADLLTRIRALAQDPSADVQLQAVLTLGEAKDPGQDVALAQVVRAHPGNRYLRDAFYSGLAGREVSLIERLAADPSWPAADAEANAIVTGLARGVWGSREVPAIQRLIAMAAAQPPAASARTAAIIDGIVGASTGPGASRRPIQFPSEPGGWSGLLANPDLKARLEKATAPAPSTSDLVLWPGKPGVAATVAPPPLTGAELARFDAGKGVFTSVCAACHQLDGRGQNGLAPPLLDSDWILGSPQASVRIIMYGLSGAISVNGRSYIGEMPGLGALDDDQIASVLTYLRREWGHTGAPVDPELVKSIRAATAGRVNPWGWRELNPYRQ